MVVVHSIADCRDARRALGDVAFVPTMGALHDGHVSLMHRAAQCAPSVAVSIFVNPTQFGRNEDLSKYPRTLEQDLDRCERAGVALAFVPDEKTVYPPGVAAALVDVPSLTDVLEGKHRPGHFRGVCQVVAKLFNVVQPQYACFGRKDYQQLRVLEAMVEALDFPLRIVACDTVRESDGLAMSSRNRYLSADERARALSISRALRAAAAEHAAGSRQANRLVATMTQILLDPGHLGHVPLAIDYAACVDARTLRPLDHIDAPALLAVAARVGATRLIDNVLLGETHA
jgi:pantoate--beta-alanine ligase